MFAVLGLLEAARRGEEPREEPSSDMSKFREVFSKAKKIVVLSGAGMSAESGVPTFRGEGGFWRKFQVATA